VPLLLCFLPKFTAVNSNKLYRLPILTAVL
jgi:hypothetical protein